MVTALAKAESRFDVSSVMLNNMSVSVLFINGLSKRQVLRTLIILSRLASRKVVVVRTRTVVPISNVSVSELTALTCVSPMVLRPSVRLPLTTCARITEARKHRPRGTIAVLRTLTVTHSGVVLSTVVSDGAKFRVMLG